jgi:hypothetical protein
MENCKEKPRNTLRFTTKQIDIFFKELTKTWFMEKQIIVTVHINNTG